MSVDELVGGPRRTTRTLIARARVTRAPATASDKIRVAVVNYSNTSDYEVPAVQWAKVPGDLPRVGDSCVVMFDDEGDVWVPVWGRT